MDGKANHHHSSKEDGHHLLTSDGVQQRAQQTMAKMKKIIASPMGKRKQNCSQLFGAPLGELMIQAGRSAPAPAIMSKLMEFIATNGLDEQGLFRVSGSAKVVEKVKTLFDKGNDVELDQFLGDISALAGVLKSFLRELPDPLIPSYQQAMFIRARAKSDGCDEKLVEELKGLVAILPINNRTVLKFLCSFLVLVTQHEDNNKMNAKGLGIVFGPNVFRCTLDGMEGLQEQTCTNVIVEKFISRYEDIFGEAPDFYSYLSHSQPTSPMSPVTSGHPLRAKPLGPVSSPPHKPKPYKQYMADKAEAEDTSPEHEYEEPMCINPDTGNHMVKVTSAESVTGQHTQLNGQTSNDEGKLSDRKVNRWNTARASPHHSPRLSAVRSPGMLRRAYGHEKPASFEKERPNGLSADPHLLQIPNSKSSMLDAEDRADSPWSPTGSALSTPVPVRILTPNSNALLDDVITQTIGERLIGEPLNADSNTDERRSSAGGSIGSGSIHRFSGEEMAEILAPGKHVNNAKLRSPNKFLLQDQIPDPLHDSDDDDDVMTSHIPLSMSTKAAATSAVVTTEDTSLQRHGTTLQAIAGDGNTFARRTSSVETTLNVGRDAQALRRIHRNSPAALIRAKDPAIDEAAADNPEGSPKQRKKGPAVPARPKFVPKRSMSEETPDGGMVSALRGPGRRFDEVTQDVEVLRPLTRDRPAGPPRRAGGRNGRERLASLPSMNETDSEPEADPAEQPLTLLDIANVANAQDVKSLNGSMTDDLPYLLVNGIRVRRKKKPESSPQQLRMSVTKDDHSNRFSLSFETTSMCNNEQQPSDSTDERIREYRSSTLSNGIKKRQLPSVPGSAPSQPAMPSVDTHRLSRPDTNVSNGHSKTEVDGDITPYAVFRTSPDTLGSTNGDERPVSASPQMLDDFYYECAVPTTEEYESMSVPEIGKSIHALKEVVRKHDKAFLERYHRKAHHPDRRAVREVIISLAAAKKCLETLKKEQALRATSPAVLQSDDSIRAHRHGVVRDFTPTPSPSPDFRQSDQRSAGGFSTQYASSQSVSSAKSQSSGPVSSPSPDAAAAMHASVSMAVKAASEAMSAFSSGSKPENAAEDIWEAVRSDRKLTSRPASLSAMSNSQIQDEKHVVQKQLLLYETAYGRPKSPEERLMMKPVYEYYKSLKREIGQRKAMGEVVASPPSTLDTLASSMVDEGVGTLSPDAFTVKTNLPKERIFSERGNRSPSPLANDTSLSQSLPLGDEPQRHGREKRLSSTFTSTYQGPQSSRKDSTQSTGSQTHPGVRKESGSTPLSSEWMSEMKGLGRGELMEHHQLVSEEKQIVKRGLKQYEDDFFQRTGRRVEKQDRGDMAVEYEEYKKAKAKLRLLETLMSKLDAKTAQTC